MVRTTRVASEKSRHRIRHTSVVMVGAPGRGCPMVSSEAGWQDTFDWVKAGASLEVMGFLKDYADMPVSG